MLHFDPGISQPGRHIDANILPLDIQEILKRKSSRDIYSRFPYKIFRLLNWAGDIQIRQDVIGIGWVDETKFKIHKKKLSHIMDIKLNTLNVNLRDLKFVQTQTDKDGWTEYSRDGFTIKSTADDLAFITSDKGGNKESGNTTVNFMEDPQSTRINSLKDINLGICTNENLQSFRKIAVSIWDELIDGLENKSMIDPEEFLQTAAHRFRAHRQLLKNALEVIRVIFICLDPNQVTVSDFASFLAKFGPEETLMDKVGSILSASNNNGNFLRVTNDIAALQSETLFYGYFDQNMHNCFVLVHPQGKTCRIYNKVDSPASERYLVGDDGTEYSSWQDYFSKHPVVSEPVQFAW